MGHAIESGFLKATTKEKAMKEGLAIAQDFAFYNVDRGENPDGSYHGYFGYFSKVFDSEEEANNFFDSLGSYRDGVVQVRALPLSVKKKYQEKIGKLQDKKYELRQRYLESFKTRTSKTVSCKHCGTRVTTEVAVKNNLHCPNCYQWMAPAGVQAKYQKLDDAIRDVKVQMKEAQKKGKPQFYYKVEVHC